MTQLIYFLLHYFNNLFYICIRTRLMADKFQRLSVFGVFAEWEAVKNAEQAKDVLSQQLSAESAAAANSQPETFNQQVTMMPVQVLKAHSRSVQSFLLKNESHFLCCYCPPPAPCGPGCSQRSRLSTSFLPCHDGHTSTRLWATALHQTWL